jgi:hypothetical protein
MRFGVGRFVKGCEVIFCSLAIAIDASRSLSDMLYSSILSDPVSATLCQPNEKGGPTLPGIVSKGKFVVEDRRKPNIAKVYTWQSG